MIQNSNIFHHEFGRNVAGIDGEPAQGAPVNSNRVTRPAKKGKRNSKVSLLVFSDILSHPLLSVLHMQKEPEEDRTYVPTFKIPQVGSPIGV